MLAETAMLFRSVNERIWELEAEPLPEHDFVCECDDDHCVQVMRLSGEEYATLRADPQQFAVVPGHEHPEVENVVGRTPRYVVVVKHAETGLH
jgi:hypothetical protein